MPKQRRITLDTIRKRLHNAPESLIQALYILLRDAECDHEEIVAIIGKKAACIRIDTYPASPELKSRKIQTDQE